jgi:hypothetical protein
LVQPLKLFVTLEAAPPVFASPPFPPAGGASYVAPCQSKMFSVFAFFFGELLARFL